MQDQPYNQVDYRLRMLEQMLNEQIYKLEQLAEDVERLKPRSPGQTRYFDNVDQIQLDLEG